MKKVLFTVYTTVFLGCFLGKAQSFTTNTTAVTPNLAISTSPANLSQFEIRGNSTATPYRNGLITQNFYSSPSATQITGNFGNTARWNSMGSLNAGTQILNGFRSQTDGRGLTMGYTVGSAGVSNPNIQWIGNVAASVTPGDLEFRVAENPGVGGSPATDNQVLRLKSNGKMVLGKLELASNFLAELDASNNANISGGMFIDVKNITLSASPVGLETIVVGSSGASGIIATASTNSFGTSIGVRGVANSNGTSIGVVGVAGNGSTRYGIYGTAGNGSFAGFFAGNVFTTGSYSSSDEKLKTTIEAETGLQKLLQLKPVSFYYNKAAIADLNMPESFQHGFIAQDMEKVFPESVMEVNAPIFKTNTKTGEQIVERIETFKGINYTSLIAVLTKAIQEQQEMLVALKNEMAALKNTQQLAKATSSGYTLSQNVPNPFSGNTIINYTLSASTERAILLVTDLNGKMQQQYNLVKGSNQQTISGNSLAAGMYLYSLIVNGNEVISKRMVLTK